MENGHLTFVAIVKVNIIKGVILPKVSTKHISTICYGGYYQDNLTPANQGRVFFSEEEWSKMTKKEKSHARNSATLMGGGFYRLSRYAVLMNENNCSYKEAVKLFEME